MSIGYFALLGDAKAYFRAVRDRKRMTFMNFRKKIKFTVIPLVLCLLVLISASYAWLTLSVAPEVTRIDTNVGANGSLEIALLSDDTYMDPLTIRASIGDSSVARDAVESNLSWGNVIELGEAAYGTEKISLLPSRLNLRSREDGTPVLDSDLLKIAQFGVDGRIALLSSNTVSAVYEDRAFTYYTDHQRYGVRAIGTISNVTPQQTALATARTAAQSHTVAAARAVKTVWREYGGGLMEILWHRYVEDSDSFDQTHVAALRDAALQTQETLEYMDLALRQGVIGMMASVMVDGPDFETISAAIGDPDIPLSTSLNTGAWAGLPSSFRDYVGQLEQMQVNVMSVVVSCNTLSGTVGWDKIEPLLDVLLDAENAYLADFALSGDGTLDVMQDGTVVTAAPDSGVLAKIAEYAGNYSTYFRWERVGNLEVRTADPVDTPHLIQVVTLLKNATAASDGWSRANLKDIYAMAVDMAFRCNVDSDLLLQTAPMFRAEETSEFPVTQGGGSYMRFTSEHMDTEALLRLMDTIRVGFLNDRGHLIGVAKLNLTNYEEQEEGIFAPLYLYDHTLQDSGVLTLGERKKDDAQLLSLSRNIPAVVTVVVWLDGDHVDNSMVGHSSSQSMTGVLNLQFSSSADLQAVNLPLKNGN